MENKKTKDATKVKKGKKSRAQGNAFESRVREDLEEKGWIVDKWTNNVELEPVYRCCANPENFKVDYGRREYTENGDELSSFQMVCDVCGSDVDGDYILCEDDIEKWGGKLVKAKAKWAGPNRPMMMGAGFPDFIAFRRKRKLKPFEETTPEKMHKYRLLPDLELIGVESKMDGELDRKEKEKCKWLLEQGIFDKILIASKHKIKNRVHIEYEDFKEKYWRFYK